MMEQKKKNAIHTTIESRPTVNGVFRQSEQRSAHSMTRDDVVFFAFNEKKGEKENASFAFAKLI